MSRNWCHVWFWGLINKNNLSLSSTITGSGVDHGWEWLCPRIPPVHLQRGRRSWDSNNSHVPPAGWDVDTHCTPKRKEKNTPNKTTFFSSLCFSGEEMSLEPLKKILLNSVEIIEFIFLIFIFLSEWRLYKCCLLHQKHSVCLLKENKN